MFQCHLNVDWTEEVEKAGKTNFVIVLRAFPHIPICFILIQLQYLLHLPLSSLPTLNYCF